MRLHCHRAIMRSLSIATIAPVLRKGVDPRKDQSYFLFSLRQPQLRRALTPLGTMTKPQIREIAHSLGLKVADKIDSQEICFVPGNDYKAFLRSHLGENEFHRGEIYDVDGNFVGEHDGIEMFTIGQRKGLPGGSPRPRYVVDLDPATNRVIVGDADDLICDEFEIDRVNWHPIAAGADRRRIRSDRENPLQPSRDASRQLRRWRMIARACDCMNLSARSHRDKLRSFTTVTLCWRRLDLSRPRKRSCSTA